MAYLAKLIGGSDWLAYKQEVGRGAENSVTLSRPRDYPDQGCTVGLNRVCKQSLRVFNSVTVTAGRVTE